MAKFLTTVGNSFYIEQIILNAEENITIVTPFLKLSETLIDRIKDAERNKVQITFIYGKSELQASQKQFLFSLKNLKIYYFKNLHAKCYHNEHEMVISSMNLYEFSERNNREMGVLIEKKEDSRMFEDALKEIESIKNAADLEKDFEVQDTIKPKNELALDPTFNERIDSYLPMMENELKKKFPDQTIEIEANRIKIKDFPAKGIDLLVSGRVDFNFDNYPYYERLKSKNQYQLSEGLPGIRFFWNHYRLNIYPEQNFKVNDSIEGFKKQVQKHMQIIEYVVKNLKA